MKRHLLVLLILLGWVAVFGVEMLYVDGLVHFIDVGNFLIRTSEGDLQLGAIYENEKTILRKVGFLRIKEADAKMSVGFTIGKSWSVLATFDVDSYGLMPARYRMLFSVAPESSYAVIGAEQKFFLGNYTINLSSFDVVGPVTMGMSRLYVKIQNREIGFYALDNALFAGFYPFSRGQTGDEGFFMGVGWKDGFSGALAMKFRVPIGNLSIVLDFILALSQDSASVGIRSEWIGENFKLNTCFVDGKCVFSVSF
ncbi:MAG: hypothetical protein H5T93_04895 [Pseudothermotoga sp.]|uniref:hypothetical protein n=1 Tax=Pseudothermotoga sp. TaxID=2033661 RepID=UPI001987EC5D|nr:hypothetical protein [Pseudothermotoga sp.]